MLSYGILVAVGLLVAVIGSSYAGDPKLVAECVRELSIANSEEIWAAFKATGQIPDESDRNAKCVFLCVAKKENAADDGGTVDVAAMKAMIAPKYAPKMSAEEVGALFDKCASGRSESDPCDKVYMFHKCHMREFLAKA